MRRRHLLWLGGILLPIAAVIVPQAMRSVRPADVEPAPLATFDAAQCTGLFVGVQKYDDDSIREVEYAVDDAIDLAHAFAFHPKVMRIRPDRIVLALSGMPRKETSKKNLQELKAAHATITVATRDEIEKQLEHQTSLAGNSGLLVLSLATHGFSINGTHYILGSDSHFPDPETALSTGALLDMAAAGTRRSLAFIDACRERVRSDARAGEIEPLSVWPSLIRRMKRVEGQAVLYAAAAGGYAYDDRKRKNGVFTARVIDGLTGCETHGIITMKGLWRSVDRAVSAWIRENQHRTADNATHVSLDSGAETMPLADCAMRLAAPPPPPPIPTDLRQPQTIDINDDGVPDVVGLTDDALVVAGKWSQPIRASKFIAARLFKKRRTVQIVVLSGSRIVVYDFTGETLSTYEHPGPLQDVFVAARTNRHNSKIIAIGVNPEVGSILDVEGSVPGIAMIEPKDGTQLWYGALAAPRRSFTRLQILDRDKDGNRDFVLNGNLCLDFDGNVIENDTGYSFSPIARSNRER